MDQRGEPFSRVSIHPLPHIEDGPTGGVDHDAAERAQRLEVTQGHPECGQNDDVLRPHLRIIEAPLARREEDDTHLAQFRVDVRVVNDLAREENASVGKLGARLIRILHRALDPVTEPEFAGQSHGHRPSR